MSLTQGDFPNYKNSDGVEPPDHAVGRSRGGLTTKIHLVSDSKCRPVGFVLTAGNAADTTMMAPTLDTVAVRCHPRGAPRRRPDVVIADKGYPSAANRAWLSAHRIRAVIPDRDDQIANRRRKGSAGGRPPGFSKTAYKGRNVVERCFNKLKNWRGIATRYDKTASSYMAGINLASTLLWAKPQFINTT